MHGQCHFFHGQKSFLTRWFWDNSHFYPIKYKIFIKAFQYILKSLQDFSVWNHFYNNAEKYK